MSPCTHTRVTPITDPDVSRVYLYCEGCKRLVGTYDPAKRTPAAA